MSEKSTPSVRFDGFTNDWEQRKLGELGSVTKGAALSKADISETGMPLILYGELYTTYSEVTYNVIRKTEAVVDDKYLSILGDILIPTSGETPEEISRATCVMVPNVILAGDLLIFRPTKEVDGRILSFIVNHKLNNKIASIAQGKSIVHIQASELCQLRVTFPTLPEQKKIASLLSSIDSTLTLCRRKLELLTQAKKALMQQIFSRKLRFTADDGSAFPDWEEKKLGDLFVKAGSGGTPKSSISEYYGGDINFLSISDVSESNGHIVQTTKKLTESGLQHSTAWIVPKGSISLAMYASVGKVAILDIDTATSQAFYNMTFSDDDLRDLLYQKLTMVNDEGGWIPLISTGTQPNLNAEKVRNYVISLPSNRTEIHRINLVLHFADALVDQARAELEQWQEVKKSLLQQMFV